MAYTEGLTGPLRVTYGLVPYPSLLSPVEYWWGIKVTYHNMIYKEVRQGRIPYSEIQQIIKGVIEGYDAT